LSRRAWRWRFASHDLAGRHEVEPGGDLGVELAVARTAHGAALLDLGVAQRAPFLFHARKRRARGGGNVILGDPGYVAFLRTLYRLGVLDHEELLLWLRLHGCVLRSSEQPLDGDEDAIADLAAELEEGA
jgi:hypothetical protein